MRIGSGAFTYEWVSPWGDIPDSAGSRGGWAHPGIAVTSAGEVVTFHPGEPDLLFFDSSGRLLRRVATDLTEGHGITVTEENGTAYLWLADPGSKNVRRNDALERQATPGRVVKMTLDGRVVLELEHPDLPAYAAGKYAPTAVAVNEDRFGGNGDVWVADGYGQNFVHRYSRFDRRGAYLGSINGAEGAAGAFACPHGIWIDHRKREPELYIADRGNHRVQVYDLEGQYKRAFGAEVFSSPSGFAQDGDYLIVAELRARLAVVDDQEHLVCYLGANEEVCTLPGWPNELDEHAVPQRTSRLEAGKFNSPHGIAADGDGNVYVAEWLIGGRITKLQKVGAESPR